MKGQKASRVREMFPRKPGSKAKRHTLFFLRSFWKIIVNYNVSTSFSGLVFNLETLEIRDTQVDESAGQILIFDKPSSFAIICSETSATEQEIWDLVLKLHSDYKQDDLNKVRDVLTIFTPGAYKSLMQKIIRFRPNQIVLTDELIYDSLFVLHIVFVLLLLHPGSFVPDIQRYVTGLESATKRLAVTICEDSYADKSMIPRITQLCVCAYLAQMKTGWKPTLYSIEKWLSLAKKAYMYTTYFDYDIERGLEYEAFTLENSQSYLEFASAFLEVIKSFEGDIGLFRDIAVSYPSVIKKSDFKNYPEYMSIIHCIDQHWAPNIAYLYEPEDLKEIIGIKLNNFGPLFKKIFQEVTGMNPRKSRYLDNFEEQPFVTQTRLAQYYYYRLLTRQTTSRKKINQLKFEYIVDRSYIAGLIGAIEIEKPARFVTMDANNIERLVVIRRPTRDMKTAELSVEQEEEAKARVQRMLEDGIPIKAISTSIKEFENISLKEEDGNYYIYPTKKKRENVTKILWDDYRKTEVILPIHPVLELTFDNVLDFQGTGLQKNADNELMNLLKITPLNYIRRAYTYLGTYNEQPGKLPKIGREGAGINYSVSLDDVGAFKLMWQMSILYPAAFYLKSPINFVTKEPRLLWYCRDLLSKYIVQQRSFKMDKTWPELKDKMNRNLWQHQIDCYQQMKKRHSQGQRGHFLWLTVGLGKTLIVLTYLAYLSSIQALPPYIIYTLPASAIGSVLVEIQAFFGQAISYFVPHKKTKPLSQQVKIIQKNPKPYEITLIEHDSLRKVRNDLLNILPSSIFIVDEVHKTLNETQRTTVALEYAHLAQDFIALTGTPVIDNKIYKLMAWLEQIVAFPLNEKNFWVAANTMIAKRSETGIKVEYSLISALFQKEELQSYNKLVSPALGGQNSNATPADFQSALKICYKACTRTIISQTIEFLNKDIGVMIVGQNVDHTLQISQDLQKAGVPKKDIFILTSQTSIYLTDNAVAEKRVPDYKVVIVPQRKAEGYTLTRLGAMITSVYPSNNANREQLEGRINRIGQSHNPIYITTVYIGLLKHIYEKHRDAKNINAVLRSLAQIVN